MNSLSATAKDRHRRWGGWRGLHSAIPNDMEAATEPHLDKTTFETSAQVCGVKLDMCLEQLEKMLGFFFYNFSWKPLDSGINGAMRISPFLLKCFSLIGVMLGVNPCRDQDVTRTSHQLVAGLTSETNYSHLHSHLGSVDIHHFTSTPNTCLWYSGSQNTCRPEGTCKLPTEKTPGPGGFSIYCELTTPPQWHPD